MLEYISLGCGALIPFIFWSALSTSARDTVSSVGFGRGDISLSGSSAAAHACHIRHALALDECRVKFMPEYFLEMNSPDLRSSARDAKQKFRGVDTSNGNGLRMDDGREVIIDKVDTPASEGSILESMSSIPGEKVQPGLFNAISYVQPGDYQRIDRKATDIKEVWFAGTHSDVYVFGLVMSSSLKLLAEAGRIDRESHFTQETSRLCGCVGRHPQVGWC